MPQEVLCFSEGEDTPEKNKDITILTSLSCCIRVKVVLWNKVIFNPQLTIRFCSIVQKIRIMMLLVMMCLNTSEGFIAICALFQTTKFCKLYHRNLFHVSDHFYNTADLPFPNEFIQLYVIYILTSRDARFLKNLLKNIH